MLPILKKEFKNYFITMTGYIFLGFFVLLTAIFFALVNVFQLYANYSVTLSNTTFVFLIIIPTLTMRMFAEEARQKTDQLLYTTPLTITEIVVGKYIAACLIFLLGMGITITFPLLISSYGDLPTREIITAFCGYILLGFCFVAVGIFVACLSDNQIISAVATFAVLFIFYMMDYLATFMPSNRVSSLAFIGIIILGIAYLLYDSTKEKLASILAIVFGLALTGLTYAINNLLFDSLISKVLKWFSLLSRFNNFGVGIFDLADVVYYVSFAAAFIYFTINVIEKRRWK